ncbi:DUF4349 domain-containing protein [Leptolyngbya sp. FACHB-261]|uniref:DUF4349 domain-containing protein n=1 Tax=Leptolyngbya sp. FACHB-261 TaxID=2692806 RepID=UPI0016854D4F|nr:DUF4349 domain-containing protein [Leptolyngbya sp. FACHB-261]MBD2104328.1 DUF4349 domain-containing protein [Leptolyngbya sp. FACHB-261]
MQAEIRNSMWVGLLLCGTVITGCASSNVPSAASGPSAGELTAKTEAPAPRSVAQAFAPGSTDNQAKAQASAQAVPKPAPQLVRTASVNLVVPDVDKAVRALNELVREQQGEVLNLQDQSPIRSDTAHRAQAQLRVPQSRFEQTLAALNQLGQVQTRTIRAEDVADQIVDYQVRLRNLRRTEDNILKIMDRSGNIEQVLRVTQELGNVRGQIEQIDAQLKSVQNRVAYSNITVSFEAATSGPVAERAVGVRLGESWKSSTRSMQAFSLDLLALGLWLIAFSPYLLVSGAALTFALRWWQRRRPQRPAA